MPYRPIPVPVGNPRVDEPASSGCCSMKIVLLVVAGVLAWRYLRRK